MGSRLNARLLMPEMQRCPGGHRRETFKRCSCSCNGTEENGGMFLKQLRRFTWCVIDKQIVKE